MGCCSNKPPPPAPAKPPVVPATAAAEPATDKPSDIEGLEKWQKQFPYLFQKGKTENEKREMVRQLEDLDKELVDGLEAYIKEAKRLLSNAKDGKNPFEGYTVTPANNAEDFRVGTTGESESKMLQKLQRFEKNGEEQLEGCAFVLVAGGMGERLGFGTKENPRIKISIIAEVTTGVTFMEMYAQYLLAFEKKIEAKKGAAAKILPLPLVIMTSDETDELTKKFLEKNSFFGLKKSQISYMKQSGVPALEDVNATLHVDAKNHIVRKPHGHGDVHHLLHKEGLVTKWKSEGRKWLVVFQDTNPLHFRCLTAILGVSAQNKYVMNSVAVPRFANEKVGGIAQLTSSSGKPMTISVEYNQLEPLLKSSGGDVQDSTGYSPYPGNTNTLVFDIGRMADILAEGKGKVEEFVNPKWADDAKSKFKTPTRLECMMQDFPKMKGVTEKDLFGYTMFDRELCFSCVKNELKEAKTAAVPDCAFSCEADIYRNNARVLQLAAKMKNKDVMIEPDISSELNKETFANVTQKLGPRIVLRPSFGISISDVSKKIEGNIVIKNQRKKCALVLEDNVLFVGEGGDALVLDGAIRIKAQDSKKTDPVVIKGLDCFNEGQKIVSLSKEDIQRDFKEDVESYQIRLYGPTLKLQNMFTLTQSWEGAGKMAGELNGGGTFTIKEKMKDK